MTKFRDQLHGKEDFIDSILNEDLVLHSFSDDVRTDMLEEAVTAFGRGVQPNSTPARTARNDRRERMRDQQADRKADKRSGSQRARQMVGKRLKTRVGSSKSQGQRKMVRPSTGGGTQKPAPAPTASAKPGISRKQGFGNTPQSSPQPQAQPKAFPPSGKSAGGGSKMDRDKRIQRRQIKARVAARKASMPKKKGFFGKARAAFRQGTGANRPTQHPRFKNESNTPLEFLVTLNEETKDTSIIVFEFNGAPYDLELPNDYVEEFQADVLENGISDEYATYIWEAIWAEASLAKLDRASQSLEKKEKEMGTSSERKEKLKNIEKRLDYKVDNTFKRVGKTGGKLGKKAPWLKKANEAKSTTDEKSLQLTANTNKRRKPAASFYDLFQNLKKKHGVKDYRIAKALTGKKLTFRLKEASQSKLARAGKAIHKKGMKASGEELDGAIKKHATNTLKLKAKLKSRGK